MAPTYQDVERAIRAVPGVSGASIGAVEGTGRGRLRIQLAAGHDPDEVALAVAATLLGRFGIDVDPAAIRPRPAEDVEPDVPLAEDAAEGGVDVGAVADHTIERDDVDRLDGPPSGNGTPVRVVGFTRPTIEGLAVGAEGLEVRVDARLRADGRDLTGHATGAATRKATLRTVARATLDAIEQLFPGQVKTEVESLDVTSDGEDEVATVTVTFLTHDGADKLIGVSIVRSDPEQAVMRATLDAVNRRVGLMVDERVPS